MRTICTGIMLSAFIATTSAVAQTAPNEQNAVMSSAGNAVATQIIKASVLVVGIDKTTRTLTLKDSQGKEFSVVASPEVRNFDQIKLNDAVHVEFVRALSLALTKADASKDISESYEANRAPIGASPAGAMLHRMSAVAQVVAIDQDKSTITLKGPRGQTIELQIENRDHFKVVQVGSRVQVEYAEAMAVLVQPETAAAAKK